MCLFNNAKKNKSKTTDDIIFIIYFIYLFIHFLSIFGACLALLIGQLKTLTGNKVRER